MNATILRSEFEVTEAKPTIKAKETKERRIQSFDCLRALACLLVIYQHSGAPSLPGYWLIGGYGVCLFCVLSGFLITSILLNDERKNSSINLIEFLQRRALRILPPYFLVLILFSSLAKLGLWQKNHPVEVAALLNQFPYYATLTHDLAASHNLGHLWSISVEEQFYCLLPLLMLAVANTRVRILSLVIVGSIILLQCSQDRHNQVVAFWALVAGASLSMANSWVTPFLQKIATPVLIAISISLLALSVVAGQNPYGPIATTAFCIWIWVASRITAELPVLRPVAYLGRISYGMYLFHNPLTFLCGFVVFRLWRTESCVITFLVTSLVTIALAALSWELFEKRVIGLRTHLQGNILGTAVALISPLLLLAGVCFSLVRVIR